MPTENWSVMTAHASLLTTQLDALADAGLSVVGTALDNGTNKDRFAVAECLVDFVSAPTDRAAIDLYMSIAPDGTNYADSADPAQYAFVGSFMVDNATAAQRLVTARFEIPPCKVKFQVKNRSGQAFPASGSIVNVYTFNRTIN